MKSSVIKLLWVYFFGFVCAFALVIWLTPQTLRAEIASDIAYNSESHPMTHSTAFIQGPSIFPGIFGLPVTRKLIDYEEPNEADIHLISGPPILILNSQTVTHVCRSGGSVNPGWLDERAGFYNIHIRPEARATYLTALEAWLGDEDFSERLYAVGAQGLVQHRIYTDPDLLQTHKGVGLGKALNGDFSLHAHGPDLRDAIRVLSEWNGGKAPTDCTGH